MFFLSTPNSLTMRLVLRTVLGAALVVASGPIIAMSPTVRPEPLDRPTRVQVNLYVIDIESIDDVGQTFKADVVVRSRWQDARVALSGARLGLDDLWHPNLRIANLRSSDQDGDVFLEVLEDHTVQTTQRFRGDLASRLDLRRFPFDRQRLTIMILAAGHSAADVLLEVDGAGTEPSFSIPNWIVVLHGSEGSVVEADFGSGTMDSISRSAVQYQLGAQRHVGFYRWRVLAPLSLVVFLSWVVFWIDPANLNPQMSVAATSILTLIAYFMSLSDLLPNVSHLTLLDEFVFACLCFVFLACVEAVISSRMASNPKNLPKAIRLDRWCRIVFPTGYVAIVFFYWT